MTLLSIDPGTKSLGYAIWKDGTLTHADFLEIPDVRPSAVLVYITAFFENLYYEQALDAVVTERMFTSMQFGGGANSAVLKCIPLELESWAKAHGMAFAQLAPVTVKKEVTGRGDAKKDLVYSYVQHLWPALIDMPKTHRFDVSDAIAIGVAAMKKGIFPEPPPHA